MVTNDMTGGGYPQGGVWEIDHGWDVFSSDGDKIGDVEEVHPHYLTVSKGFFFPSEKYVPVSSITSVDGERVYVGATKSEIDNLGWDTIPDDTATYTDTSYTDTTTYTDTMDTTRGVETTGTTGFAQTDVSDRDEIEVPLVEEELSVSKHSVERGRVIVRKGVRTEQQTVNVPIREEEVHVERRIVDGDYVTGEIPANAFQETEIEIPLRGEEVDVTKQARVREVVEIDKDVVEHQERVTDTVRREEVFIEGADDLGGQTGLDRRGMGTTGTSGVTDTAGADSGEGVLGRLEDRIDPSPNQGGRPTGS